MQLKFNPQETNVQNTQAAYIQYKKWLTQNGVLCDPRVRYPSYFGDKGKGVVGVSANKPIQKNRAIIAVPYNLLITMDKVLNVKILEKIVNQNPDVFGVSQHAVMKMLILYVCHELLKGQESFYFPYFEICKDSYLEKWTHWEMTALESPSLMRSLKREKQEIETFFLEFLRLFTKYEDIFPTGKGNIFYQKLFERAYTFVTTRAFGWSLPSISLIPMADSLNHGNNYLNHFLVDTREEQNPSETYKCYKQKSNLSILKEEHLNPSQNQLNELRKKKKHRYQKFVEKHKEIITSSKEIGELSTGSKVQNSERNRQYWILSEQYKSETRNFRQLHFYESSCSEDNDTDEDQLTEFTMKREQFQFDEKYSAINKNAINKKGIIKKYWKLWTDNSLEQNQDDESQQEEQQMKESKKQSSKMKESLENYNQKHKQSEGSSDVPSTDSEDDDENFDWMKPHSKDEYKNCYFVMETTSIVRENEELHNFYGRRTNRFLLQSYNFVMANNQYDSFAFRLYADSSLNVKPNTEKLIFMQTRKQLSQKSICSSITRQIRLKGKRINQQLINHCRCYTIQFQKKQFTNAVYVTLPFDREIQLKTLRLYKQIIQTLKGQYMTQQDDDKQLLEKSKQHEIRTAIEYRIMQKNILKQQIQMIQKCIQLLTKRWKNGRIQKPTWKDMKQIVKYRSYVMSLQRGKIK